MSSCTYKFKNASGEEVTITGQAEMKAFLANGGLEQLLPGKVLPWRGGSVAAPAESPKAKAKTGPATAQQAIDAFNADDSAAAMDVVARLKLEALSEVGAAIGFRPQIHENAKSYRSRLAEVAEKLTKTGREEGKKKRALWDRMSLLASDWDRMERHTGTPEGSYDGKWMTHAQARPYLLAEIGSLQSSPYFAEIRPMVENARPSIFNALDSVSSPAESPAVESAEDRVLTIDDIDTLVAGLNDGTVSADAYKAAWQAFQKSADTIKAGLHKLTKSQLLDKVGGILAYRMKGENKPDIVNAVFDAARNVFSLGRDYGPQGYFMGEYEEYKEAQKKAFADMIDATTDEDLKAYADKIAEANAERRQAANALEKAIQNPQTLDDFRKYVTAKLRQGMSESEVRMSLTPEQRAKMDDLHAEDTRKGRASRPAPAVTAASVTTGGDIVATKHTKTGEDLYVVRPAERVERDQYNSWNATAKRMGGWYSSFRGNGAVPGFQFKTRESADAFLAYVGGDTEGAKQVAQERRDAFADDRSQSAVERLTEMADRLEDRADESLSRDRKANTARRASMAASAEASASADKAMARTMRNIANAIKDGKAKFLDKVRQKVQVEMLRSFVSDAKYKQLTARYPSYVDFERNRHEPATAETADYATFPKYTADRADLARMGRELELIDGAKKLGQQLLKVADDVTDEYLKFVKENLNKVSTFRAGGGGPAVFSSRDDAERAIARSGFRGKAIVYAVKRGQNMVVMGPSMAKENGLWTADTSKRITLTDEAGEEITAKIESLNRNRERVYLPHQFSTTRERRAKLKAMGIETSAEFRAALREFIALSEAPSRPSKVKELERSMVGRKNDGLDFFPTPAGIAQQMIEAAEIKEGMRVLEPSAGMGHIAEQIRESGVDPDVVEFSSSRRELLEAKGFNVVANDFMEASGEYDRIIMNPPFSDRRDAQHVQHAYGLLKPGGRIVAIMGEGVFFGQDKKAESFREWLDSVGGSSEKLPDGTFLDPSLPVNTATNARLVVIDRPADAPKETEQGVALYEIDENGDPSPEEAEAVQRGLEGKNPIEAAAWLAENAPMKFAVIAEKVRDKLQSLADAGVNFGLSIVRPGDLGEAGLSVARGVTAPVRNGDRVDIRIALNGAGMTGRVGTSYRTATHELAHAATMQSVQLGMSGFPQYAQAVRDLVDVANAIGDHLRSRMKADKETWTDFERAVFEKRANFMRSVDEVLVWGMTSPEAQAYLESIPYKSKSLWTSFVEAVRKVLGLSAHNDTALSEVLRIADVLLKPIDMDSLAGFVGLDSQYEIQQPYGGRVFKNPGGVPDAKWTGEAVDEGAARLSEHTAVLRTDTLPDTITVNGVERPTTNSTGKPIHPTEEGVRKFWEWFAGSKVVDEQGRPLVMYHGTGTDFDRFDLGLVGRTFGTAADELGFFFSSNPETASKYAINAGHGGGGNVMPVYVRIADPLSRSNNFLRGPIGFLDWNRSSLKQQAESNRNDGILIRQKEDGEIHESIVVAFRPEQIKSAIGNAGTFDPSSPDIRFRNDYPDTQAFREWFGNSKMTNKAGEPLLFMHGSPASFEAFDLSKLGASSSHTSSGLGHFFTRDRATAEKYADGGNIYTGWLRIEKPYVMMLEEAQAFDDAAESAKRRAELQKQGYDGAVILDDEGKTWATVAFEPWQFKSTDNNGSFDEFDDRMRFRDDPSSMRDAPAVPRDQAEEFIRKFVSEYPGAPQIMLADSFDQLPKDIQKDALTQGSGPTRAKGAMKNGATYVVLNNHHSMADLEATVFHEILGHTGIRKLLGPQFSQELNKLFVGLGGYSGLKRIMEARGMGQQFEGYFRGIQQARASNPDAWTDALAKSILTEEVFAHIAEQKNAKQLRDRFMALVGMVRDWLRRHGFMDLASLGESDIVFMLQHAREGLRDGSGIVRDGATVGENEIVGEDGRPIAKEGSPEYEALKLLSGRLGLRERSGPTVFKDGLRDDGNEGQDAGMDDANNVAGKQAPNPAGDVEQGGATPRYTSRNWQEWYELPQFQSDDQSSVLFNHGRGGYISQVELRTTGVFDGLFALRSPGLSERGSDVTAFRIPNDKMLYQRDLDYDLDYEDVAEALIDVFPRKIEQGDDSFDEAWKAIVEDRSDFESLGLEYDGSVREDSFMDILGYKADDAGEASWFAQKLRGRLAAKLGYQAVQMDDENGSSWYIAPGVKSIPLPNEQSTSARPDVAVFRTDTSPSSKAADGALLRTINTAGGRKTVRDHVAEAFSNITGESAKTFNWWQRTIGLQYGKAKSDKDFGRVYDAAHAFLDGVSAFAKEASERASGILPHLDTWRDVSAGLNVKKQWADSQDYQAIAPAIFDGTLANGTTGKVWTDEQLRDKYSLNDKQIGHYREFRAAVDFSLETLAASEMARLARASKMDAADRDMGMDDALSFYLKQLDPRIKAARDAVEGKGGEIVDRHTEERAALEEAAAYLTEGAADLLRNEMQSRHDKEIDEVMGAERSLENLRASFTEKVEQIRKLQSEGYAPLMRFGQYTVDVARLDDEGRPLLDEDGNPDRPFFGMFESESEARKAEKILTEEYPGYSVTRGVLSTEANQLYRGLTPETAEMFARLLGTDENEAFQAYLKQAVANRSAMKRLINRMGIEGFATDVPRVLSAFITSNARLSSGNWYFGEMSKAVEAIPKHKGDVKTDAVKLMQYVQNPVEEAAGLRGFLFFSFLGGSVASAVVNLTQTFTTTLPYLSQFGAGDVAKALPKAMALSGRMMKKGLDAVSDKDLKDALRKASDEGVVDPQEIHLLMAEASGNGASVGLSGLAGAINKEWATPAARVTRSLTQAWGMLFGAAEKYNRHVAFIAAWEVAPEGVDRYEFAKNAVTETQFDYTKANRPNWARGAVGATLFTFKTFSINYVEFMSRLPPRERAIALGVLFLLAGMSGMPGADDLDDVVDTVAQKMGYNWNNTAARHAWLVRTLGTGGADFVERGVSSALPLDVSSRLGMGNLVPGTGVLQKSNTSPVRDVQEFFGPAGSVVAGFRDVFDNAGSGKGVIDTALPLMPKMFKDLHQAVDMVQTGQYRDMKGRKVVDVDGVDAVLKGIGFQPNSVASPRRVERMLAQSAGMQRVIRQDISELWARGVAEQDAEKVASARTILREWNEKNPESKITMNPASIAQRVRAMRLTSADRLVKATPKDMRGALAAEMAVQQ